MLKGLPFFSKWYVRRPVRLLGLGVTAGLGAAVVISYQGCTSGGSSFVMEQKNAEAQAVCLKAGGEIPLNAPAGVADSAAAPSPFLPIKHIVVIMQENHSFDNYFGRLNQPGYYGSGVDGVAPTMSNPGVTGAPTAVFHQ